jgi:uncharacterized phage infection (PIP) family protein YhgE
MSQKGGTAMHDNVRTLHTAKSGATGAVTAGIVTADEANAAQSGAAGEAVVAAGGVNAATQNAGSYADHLKRVSTEYQKLREEYMKLSDNYKAMCSVAAAAPKARSSGDTDDREAISNALIEAERTAKRIVDEAKYEAYRITESAKKQCEEYEAKKAKTMSLLQEMQAHVCDLQTRLSSIVKKCKGFAV